MTEKDLKQLFDELDRIEREVTTPQQAKEHLFSLGMIDENGDLAPQYRSAPCQ